MRSVAHFFLFCCCVALVKAAPRPAKAGRQPLSKDATFQSREFLNALQQLGLNERQVRRRVKKTGFKLSPGMDAFNRNLMTELINDNENELKNVIYSPFSIHLALSMLYYASPESSPTHQQIANALGLSDDLSEDYKLNYLQLLFDYDRVRRNYNAQVSLANKILIKNSFTVKPDYSTILQAYFLSSVDSFETTSQAEQVANQFVSLKSQGLIKQLYEPGSLDALVKIILINVIYYKADWKYQFKKSLTSPMVFKLLGGKEEMNYAQGMNLNSNDIRWGRVNELDATVFELPYVNSDFNMYIGLPKENSLKALNTLARKFSYRSFARKLDSGDEVIVQMPSFDASFDADLRGSLVALGMEDMFDDYLANFNNMTDNEVAVGKVKHKAVVKVNEEGSEAAAVTAIEVGIRSGDVFGPVVLKVDRPFVFMIHDKRHDVPLFMGRVINPAGHDNPGATIPHTSASDSSRSPSLSSTSKTDDSDEYSSESDYDYEVDAIEKSLASDDDDDPFYDEEDCNEDGFHHAEDPDGVSFPCKGMDSIAEDTLTGRG